MNLDAKRYYALLGLDPSCSDDDVRGAFRRRAKELHPDSVSGDATAFIRLKRAYDTLSDPERRAQYDRVSSWDARRRTREVYYAPTRSRARVHRSRGMSFTRYCVAFLFVGGLSFGAIEAMISYAGGSWTESWVESPRPASLLAVGSHETGKDDGRGATRTPSPGYGFWDPSSGDGTPRASTHPDHAATAGRPSGLGSPSSE